MPGALEPSDARYNSASTMQVVSGPDLSVTVNGLHLPNPFVIGSGPPGTNCEWGWHQSLEVKRNLERAEL